MTRSELLPTTALTHSVVFETALGWFGLCWHDSAVVRIAMGHRSAQAVEKRLPFRDLVPPVAIKPWQQELVARIEDFTAGGYVTFGDVNLDLTHATRFQRRVLMACRQIPWGQTRTYAELASSAGSPRAARAVGTVMANNHFPIVIPCHRVVGSNHRPGGFSAPGGLTLKRRLLRNEGIELPTSGTKLGRRIPR